MNTTTPYLPRSVGALLAPLVLALLLLALLVAAGLAATPALAQPIVYDDYEDDDVSEYFTFDGGSSIALGTTDTDVPASGGSFALTADFASGVNGGFVGGFGKNDTNADLTGAAEPYLNLIYKFNAGSSNTALTLEVNVQEDEDGDGAYDPNLDDEFRALIVINGGTDFQRISVPISALLLNRNGQAGGDGVFNGTVAGVVFAVNGATPDDGAGDAEGGQIVLDNLGFSDGLFPAPAPAGVSVYDDYEDDDVSEYFTFAGATGVTLGTTTDVPDDGGTTALTADFATGAGGFIGGFGKNDIIADVTGFTETFLNFDFKFNAGSDITSFTLEANVQEDEDGDGAYDPNVDDEFRLLLEVRGTSTFRLASVPIKTLLPNQNGQAGGDGVFNGTVAGIVFAINGATPDDGVGDAEGGRLIIDNVALSDETPIPVELTTFNATVQGADVQLAWATASETNNAGFEVQHAVGAGVFREAGFVNGAGTTDAAQRYAFRVTDLTPGTHRFRLKQVDFDGTAALSDVEEVDVAPTGAFAVERVRPNPLRGTGRLRFTTNRAERVEVALYNVLGQRVETLYDGVPTTGTWQTVRLDAAGLASGVYFVRVTSASAVQTERVTIVR